ncbi:MAG: preprotein translocase subunit YajC [Halomonas sp.]|uniref:preprotein translocase subunit YajC n=1 Tax=Halomonas sp. TaxID=1486246 RepID=UPI003F916FC7
MSWLVIAGVMAMLVAPLMWLKPSPRQKRLVALRGEARKLGIEVKMDVSPAHQAKGLVAVYRWPYPGSRPGPDFMLVSPDLASPALKVFSDGWCWRTEPLRPLPEPAQRLLSRLPAHLGDSVLAIGSSRSALTLWWDEALYAQQLPAFVEPLAELRDALEGCPDQR